MRLLIFPPLAKSLHPNPHECYKFWDFYCKGFSTPCRDLNANDVIPQEKEVVRRVLGQMLTSNRGRMLLKITGWPRLGYLREIFPDAKFIHVVRDGRAVMNSLLNVKWWWGWRGPQNWRWGPLDSRWQAKWEEHAQSFVALAGIQWNIIVDAARETKDVIDEKDYMEIRYEEICLDHIYAFRRITGSCELDHSDELERYLELQEFVNTSSKWGYRLSERQIEIAEDTIHELLTAYCYVE